MTRTNPLRWLTLGWLTHLAAVASGASKTLHEIPIFVIRSYKSSKYVEPVQVCMGNECHGSKDGRVCRSVRQPTTLVQTELVQQLVNGLPWNYGPDIHGSQQIYPKDPGDPFTIHVATL